MFRISQFRTTDIHRRPLGQCLRIKIVFPNQLTMCAGILLMCPGILLKTFLNLYKVTM